MNAKEARASHKIVDTLPYHYGAIFTRLMTAYCARQRKGNLMGGLRNPCR